MQSQKCPKCSLVNFAGDESCKRCGENLSQPAANENVIQEPFLEVKPTSNLFNCVDCGGNVSSNAEFCPHCGRFYQTIQKTIVDGTNWVWRIAWGVVIGCFLIVLVNLGMLIFFFSAIAGAASGNHK